MLLVMGKPSKLILLGLCVLVAAAGGVTLAAFSGQTSSAGNTFAAASTFPGQLRMASGTYTGNGNDNRSISGIGFQPDVVILKGDTGETAMLSTSTMAGDTSKRLVGGNSFDSDRVQALEADGFQLGKHNSVNGSDRTYYWTAFKAAPGVLKVGTYTGNSGTQSITGVGFSPEYLMIASAGGERAVQWFAGATNTYRFENDGGVSNGVTASGSDGFTLGSANDANNGGRTYHYVAFNQSAGNVKVGTYGGNGGTQSVSGVGFEPEYTMVRSTGTATGQHRSQSVPGSQSMYFTNNANITTAITDLRPDGFDVGNHSSVNTGSTTYQYVAFNNGAGGCARPSQGQILLAANDSWVDQSSPSNNSGGDSVLKVTSKDSNQNTRAFVDFDLPTLPGGCVVTNAMLYANNKSPLSGRTLEVSRAATSWGENSITWSNQPAPAGTPATATTTSSAGYMGWDVTSLTADLYSSGNHGFRIADQTEGFSGGVEQQFSSREDTSTPPAMLLSIGS